MVSDVGDVGVWLGSEYDADVTCFAEDYPAGGRPDEPQLFLGGYGEMVSAFAPVLDKSGRAISASTLCE